MMKINILKIVALILLPLSMLSCSEGYLETSPTDAVPSTDAFKTTESAMQALNGVHRLMYRDFRDSRAGSEHGGQSGNMIYMDMLGEDLVNTQEGNGAYIGTYQWLSHRNQNSSSSCWYPYAFNFKVINNVNPIILNIDAASGSEKDRANIKAQALTYRAWAYFQMVQLYGNRFDAASANDGWGVSLILTTDLTPLPRATVKQVYEQINKDLDDAIELFATASARNNISHLNLNVAHGIKARVALTMQDWKTAAANAQIARNGYPLMQPAQYMEGFNDYNNPEWIWGSHQQADQTTYFWSFFAYLSCNFNSTNIRSNPKAINSLLFHQISATDIRKQLWDSTGKDHAFPTPPGGLREPYMTRKFISAGGSASSIGDLPLMRAAEMYLIEAEANAHLGNDVAAQDILFSLVQMRDASYTLSTNTGNALLEEIWTQRRIELWGEGMRFTDLKRLNLPLDRTGANHNPTIAEKMQVATGDKQWQFLLPKTEIDNSNGIVVQNPL